MRTIAISFALVLTSCANGAPGFRPLSYREPAETRVFVSAEDCERTEGLNVAPVLASLALGAASRLLEGFGTAMTNASAGGALPSSVATANVEVPRGVVPRCLIVIRGAFHPTDRGRTPIQLPATTYAAFAAEGDPQALPLPDVYELHHYVELQMSGSADESALSYAPVYTDFRRSMDGSTTGRREVSITVRFDRPGREQTGSVLLIGARPLGTQQTFRPSQNGRFPYESAWFSSFHAAPAAAPGEESPARDRIPLTVTTTIIETRPTRQFLAFVATVFNGSRPEMEAALKGEIDPATREGNRSSAYQLAATYAVEEAKARNALITYCTMDTSSSASSRWTASGAARNQQLLTNLAARAADVSEPFPSSRLIQVTDGSPSAQAGCRPE